MLLYLCVLLSVSCFLCVVFSSFFFCSLKIFIEEFILQTFWSCALNALYYSNSQLRMTISRFYQDAI